MYSGGNKCCLAHCTSVSFLKNTGVKFMKFHRFPKDLKRCIIWIEKCNPIYLPSIDPSVLIKKYRLCSLHFEDKMYVNCNKTRLSTKAIPTLFEDNINISESKLRSININEYLDEIISIDDQPSCLTTFSTSNCSSFLDASTSMSTETYSPSFQIQNIISSHLW